MNDRQLEKAVEIANRAPDLHPWFVALNTCRDGADFEAFVVGLLHDSLEDGYATEYDLMVFPGPVADAVHTLTRGIDESYGEYIERVRTGSALARRVKVADAEVNLARSLNDETQSRVKRYQHVIDVLTKEES